MTTDFDNIAEYDQSHSEALDLLRKAKDGKSFCLLVEEARENEAIHLVRVLQVIKEDELLSFLSATFNSCAQLFNRCVASGLIETQLDVISLLLNSEVEDLG